VAIGIERRAARRREDKVVVPPPLAGRQSVLQLHKPMRLECGEQRCGHHEGAQPSPELRFVEDQTAAEPLRAVGTALAAAGLAAAVTHVRRVIARRTWSSPCP
jgi:hypothetical protein